MWQLKGFKWDWEEQSRREEEEEKMEGVKRRGSICTSKCDSSGFNGLSIGVFSGHLHAANSHQRKKLDNGTRGTVLISSDARRYPSIMMKLAYPTLS